MKLETGRKEPGTAKHCKKRHPNCYDSQYGLKYRMTRQITLIMTTVTPAHKLRVIYCHLSNTPLLELLICYKFMIGIIKLTILCNNMLT